MIDKGDVLLQQDVANMDYKQLAAWIDDCRNVVARSDSTPYEEYITDVGLFCKAWAQFYEQNKEYLTDKKIQKALRYLHFMKHHICRIRIGSKTYTYNIPEVSPEAPYYKSLMSDLSKEFRKDEELFVELLSNKDAHRTEIGKYVKDKYFKMVAHDIQVFKDGKLLKAESMEEFLKNCESKQTIIVPSRREYHASYEKRLLNYGINKTLFKSFISKEKCEQEFGKKFFVNMSLILEFSSKSAETFMLYNGYSMADSMRKFDIVCQTALRMGFGRDYTIALIDRWNEELKKEFGDDFVSIPNLALQKSNK